MAEVETIAHGTTLVTNAVIERRGAKTGMLVTAGFRDILDMGFEQRYDLFDLRLTWPDPLAPRRLRREVPERVGHDGQVLAALDLESTRATIRDLVETAGVEAFAICFLHSYANPVHEEAAGELVRAEFPDLHVSRSAEVFGNMREYASIAGGARARERSARARSGSATPSSSARPSTATHSRWGRRSRVRPSAKSASRPACSAPATGQRWARA